MQTTRDVILESGDVTECRNTVRQVFDFNLLLLGLREVESRVEQLGFLTTSEQRSQF